MNDIDHQNLSSCKKELVEPFIGKNIKEVKSKLPKVQTRIEKPGMMYAMDYREDRLRIILDENGVITSVLCG